MRTRQTWSAGSLHPGKTWPILAVLAISWLGTIGCGGYLGRTFFGKKPENGSMGQIRPLSGNPEALLRNAHYFQLMGRPDLAVRELEEACQLAPHNLKVVNALARSYEELGKFEQSRQVYQEALNRHGAHPGLQNNLCFSYYQEARWKEAEACFRQTLARNPGNAAARNNLGLLLCRLGRSEEARRLWRDSEGEAVAQTMLNQAREALGSHAAYAQASPAAGAPPSAAAEAKSSPDPVQSLAKGPEPAPAPGPQVAVAPKPENTPATMAAKSPQAAAPQTPDDSAAPPAKTVFQEAAGSKRLTRPPVVNAAKASPTPVQSSAKLPETPPAPASSVVVMSSSPEKPADLIAARSPQAAASETPGDSAAPPAKAVSPAAAPVSKMVTRPLAAAAAKSSPDPVQSSAKFVEPDSAPAPPVAAAAPGPEKAAAPALVRPRLTAQELWDTRILVVNGAGIPKLAQIYRTLLSAEGFHVGRIGNHFDFGAENTTIYYLPEAEKVAQALQAEHFPHSRMASKEKLPPGAQIKLVLGHDLERQEKVLAMK